MSDHMPVNAVFEVAVANRLDKIRMQKGRGNLRTRTATNNSRNVSSGHDSAVTSSPVLSAPRHQHPASPSYPLPSRHAPAAALKDHAEIEIVVQVPRDPASPFGRFLRVQWAVHQLLEHVDLILTREHQEARVDALPLLHTNAGL